jgi:hypothetical protein
MTDTPAERAPTRPLRRLARSFISPDSYGSVLLLILVTYWLSVVLTSERLQSAILAVQILAVWGALRVSRTRRGLRIFATAALALAAVVAVSNAVWTSNDALRSSLFLSAALMYLIAPAAVVRAIVQRPEVDQEVVLGAIDAYLLVGMFFAFVYQSVAALQSGPFFGAQGDGKLPQYLFFSFTTLTTTGYGNLIPAENPGQSLAVLEMLVGQLFLVTAVAKVISAWQPARWRAKQAGGGGDPSEGTR